MEESNFKYVLWFFFPPLYFYYFTVTTLACIALFLFYDIIVVPVK